MVLVKGIIIYNLLSCQRNGERDPNKGALEKLGRSQITTAVNNNFVTHILHSNLIFKIIFLL